MLIAASEFTPAVRFRTNFCALVKNGRTVIEYWKIYYKYYERPTEEPPSGAWGILWALQRKDAL